MPNLPPSEGDKSVTFGHSWLGPADGKLLHGGTAGFASPPLAPHRAPAALPSSVCTSCCSTTRNFLTRYFQTSPKKALITGAKSPSPYLAPHDGGGDSWPCGSNTDPWKLLVKLTSASSPSGHTAKMRNSHNFPPLTSMTPCYFSLCRQIKQVMPSFQPGRWVTLSSPSPPVPS